MVSADLGVDLAALQSAGGCPFVASSSGDSTGVAEGEDAPSWALPAAIAAGVAVVAMIVMRYNK